MNDQLAKEAAKEIATKSFCVAAEVMRGNIRKAILIAKEALTLLEGLEYYQANQSGWSVKDLDNSIFGDKRGA